MSNKVIFLIVAVLLVVTLGLAGGFFMMWNKLSDLNTQANAAAIAPGGQGQAAETHGVPPGAADATQTMVKAQRPGSNEGGPVCVARSMKKGHGGQVQTSDGG